MGPWLDGFRDRHGPTRSLRSGDELALEAQDGARAWVHLPFPTLAAPEVDCERSVLDHVLTDRRVGCLLVRRGGFAVGVFEGHRLVSSKVGSAYVQGRTKAGGWSQQRYARRRDNQSRKAYAEAADEAAALLLPELPRLEALVTGGDGPAVSAVLADPRLAPLRPLVQPRVLPVPDPRLRVLRAFGEQFLAVRIDLNDLA
ncbi:acVLRF1 family peptidyl-tRNA hydrolase [Microlunatus panaciterrae]|uniref:Actinobacteria/chloroflexi VLRF1 release factor domain-containing protein n=1 Tax=Microlunatus panaciterrae TaxID=400768 RepID=A0ABS2RGQ3_9ACTN|nr:hypothetical protein [Microlunatus panaciterrae]